MNKLIILALAITAISAEKFNWAVLIAGSDGYTNYRHQSDICHAYQVLKSHGMDENHIIVMAKDDIANNSRNPIKGKIYNRPDGDDVYEGCKIDYRGNDVTPENWMKIMKGDKEGMKGVGTGKVLESNEQSNVFMYFSDHGASGLIAFPSDNLYADEFKETMIAAYNKKLFKKLVFYLEACYSGSMFEKFPEAEQMNIYGFTAATAHQSSYAAYCGNEAKVGGIKIGSCLGDEFSCNWMENSDAVDLTTYTMGEQVKHVKSITKGSQPQEYGDLTPKEQPLIEFQGEKDQFVQKLAKFLGDVFGQRELKEVPKVNKIKNTDMLLAYLKDVAENSNDVDDWHAYQKEIIMHKRSKKIFRLFRSALGVPRATVGDVDFNCYRNVMAAYKHECGLNMDRDHKYLTSFYNYCSMGLGVKPAYYALKNICSAL